MPRATPRWRWVCFKEKKLISLSIFRNEKNEQKSFKVSGSEKSGCVMFSLNNSFSLSLSLSLFRPYLFFYFCSLCRNVKPKPRSVDLFDKTSENCLNSTISFSLPLSLSLFYRIILRAVTVSKK